jgi:hypothetical protein
MKCAIQHARTRPIPDATELLILEPIQGRAPVCDECARLLLSSGKGWIRAPEEEYTMFFVHHV